jgi:PAS domain-containing protein
LATQASERVDGQGVIDCIPTPTAYLDRGLRLQYANLGFARWRGRPRSALLGLTLEEAIGAETFTAMRPMLELALAGEAAAAQVRLE